MTREQAIEIIKKEYACVDAECDIERSCSKCELMMPSKEPILEAYKMAISALEQQPCDDAISREDVIKLVECSGYDLQFRTDNADMCDDVRKLPSVQPSRKGHWIEGEEWCETVNGFERWGNDYTCSECGLPLGRYTLTDFCPNCGADMRGDTE